MFHIRLWVLGLELVAVWEGLGGMVLLEKVCHWVDLRF